MGAPSINWERPPDADKVIDDAIRVIEALLRINNLHNPMKRKFISNCLWWVTEAEGRTKYDIRYWTQGALDLVKKNNLQPKQYGAHLQHEHVRRRQDIIKKLIARPADARRIACRAIGCVVTRDEHQLLAEVDRQTPKVLGWKRYKQAGLVVIDRKTGRERRTSRKK